MSNTREFGLLEKHKIESAWWSECEKLSGESGTFIYEPGLSPKVSFLIKAPFTMGFNFKGKLYGRLRNGMYISLWNIYVSQQSLSTSELHVVEISGSHALIGFELYKDVNATFKSITVQYPGLYHLLGYHPLTTRDMSKKGEKAYIATWELESKIRKVFTVDHLSSTISFHNGFNESQAQGDLRVQYRDYLKMTPRKKCSIWSLLDLTRQVEVIMEILAQNTMHPLYITLKRIKKRDKNAEENRDIYLLFRTDYKKLELNAGSYSIKPLLPEGNVKKYMQGWFSLPANQSDALSRLRDVLFENKTTSKELTTILQVFETAFNEHPSGRLVSKAAYKRVKKTIKNALANDADANDELVEAIDRALQHANSSKLSDRLENMCQFLPEQTLKEILGEAPVDELASIVRIRNNYTHGNKGKGIELTEQQIKNKAIRIYRFVVILLLIEIGVPQSAIHFKP